MTCSAASPSIFDLCLLIYHLICPCSLDFLKVVGPMCAKRGWNAFILIRKASMVPTTSSRSSTSNLAELCLPTFVRMQSSHFIGHNTDVRAVINVLKNEEMIQPSKWCDATTGRGLCQLVLGLAPAHWFLLPGQL